MQNLNQSFSDILHALKSIMGKVSSTISLLSIVLVTVNSLSYPLCTDGVEVNCIMNEETKEIDRAEVQCIVGVELIQGIPQCGIDHFDSAPVVLVDKTANVQSEPVAMGDIQPSDPILQRAYTLAPNGQITMWHTCTYAADAVKQFPILIKECKKDRQPQEYTKDQWEQQIYPQIVKRFGKTKTKSWKEQRL